jgi:hypothetical protein
MLFIQVPCALPNPIQIVMPQDAHWWASPALSGMLGFVTGFFSNLLLEPLKIRLKARFEKDQVRVLLYQDLGRWAALTELFPFDPEKKSERQLSDDQVTTLYQSLNVRLLEYVRGSKPELFYALPYKERTAIEYCYGEMSSWIAAADTTRATLVWHAARIALVIERWELDSLDARKVARFKRAAIDAWDAITIKIGPTRPKARPQL